jgi:hypothetical protein
VLQTFPNDVATTVTDGTGRFTFVSVPPGSYSIESRLMSSAPPPPSPPLRSLLATIRHPVEVGQQDIDNLKPSIRSLLTIRGRVEFDTTGPGPQEPRPAPANFTLIPAGSNGATVRMVGVGTGFAFEKVPASKYLLSAPATGGWTVTSIRVNGEEKLHRAFDLSADTADVVVTMKNQNNRLNGTVTDSAGATVPGAQVVLFPADFKGWTSGGRSPLATRSVTASARGSFTMSALNDGDYFLVAFSTSVENDGRTPGALEAIASLGQKLHVDRGVIASVSLTAVLPEIPKSSK